jgi:beta-glucosidase
VDGDGPLSPYPLIDPPGIWVLFNLLKGEDMSFPKEFMLGAATAAHQVEGNNIHSDFWAMEQTPASMFKEPSLDAVDHYNRFKEDIDFLAGMGLNAYRFSIEWARIQPEKSRFDNREIAHYREMLEYCHAKGVQPIVTMHHFSSPKWLILEGGWENETTTDYFAEYCAYTVKELGGLLDYVCTINEANMGLQLAKITRDMMSKMKAAQSDKPRSGNVQIGINTDMGNQAASRMAELSKAFGSMDLQTSYHFLSGRSPEGDMVTYTPTKKPVTR